VALVAVQSNTTDSDSLRKAFFHFPGILKGIPEIQLQLLIAITCLDINDITVINNKVFIEKLDLSFNSAEEVCSFWFCFVFHFIFYVLRSIYFHGI
uniref:Uncharacterized protein n=1 Tax=Wuchereria bancrofti TaxID=6293 RepID=A0A1I8EI19_WUCBA